MKKFMKILFGCFKPSLSIHWIFFIGKLFNMKSASYFACLGRLKLFFNNFKVFHALRIEKRKSLYAHARFSLHGSYVNNNILSFVEV